MDKQEAAEASRAIGQMLRAWERLASKITPGTVTSFLVAIEDCSLKAVLAATDAIRKGKYQPYNYDFPPEAPRFAAIVREFEALLPSTAANDRIPAHRIPEGYQVTADGRSIIVPMGKPIPDGFKSHGGSVDFGGGSIDLAPLTIEERDYVFKHHGKTEDGRSMSGMTVDEIRAAISQPSLALGERKMPVALLKGFR